VVAPLATLDPAVCAGGGRASA